MSDLSRPHEALIWCNDWLQARGPVGLLNRLTAAQDHLRDVDRCERDQRWPSDWNPEHARQAARFLRDVLGSLRAGHQLDRAGLELLYRRNVLEGSAPSPFPSEVTS